MDEPKVDRRVVKTIRTEITLERKQYEKILREAVGAPDNATVEIEDTYGGDITITWTEYEHEGND